MTWFILKNPDTLEIRHVQPKQTGVDPDTGEPIYRNPTRGEDGFVIIGESERSPLENEYWDEASGDWVFNVQQAAEKAEKSEVINRDKLIQALKTARQRILTAEGEISTLKSQMQQAIQEIQSLKSRVSTLEGN